MGRIQWIMEQKLVILLIEVLMMPFSFLSRQSAGALVDS
jgi:hypothetical protein